MQESHKGRQLTTTDFNALMENLIAAMDVKHISIAAQNRLLVQLAPMRHDIISQGWI
jgi:hemoglobin